MVTAALPPDVRKACGFPMAQLISAGLRPMEAVASFFMGALRKGGAFPHIRRRSRYQLR
ncbi:MAG: hypothetical protein QOI77_2630 [Blastocatellia bacterium]|jgi:hypothetical protein|nr:hypothetical protein [Blastocatellia bacterium]